MVCVKPTKVINHNRGHAYIRVAVLATTPHYLVRNCTNTDCVLNPRPKAIRCR